MIVLMIKISIAAGRSERREYRQVPSVPVGSSSSLAVFLSPAASSLLVGGFIGALGLVMAFGAGVLISAVAYEHGGKLAGLFTVLGFAVSVAIVVMERS